MAQAQPGETFEATYDAGISGLAGTLAVKINDNVGNDVVAATTAGITEIATNGIYVAILTAPVPQGQYSIIWSNDGTFAAGSGGEEDLLVSLTGLPAPAGGATLPDDSLLCNAWTTAAEVVECCSAQIGSDTTFLEESIVAASEGLYLASGKQYPGVCEATVRPCRTDYCRFGFQVLSRGHLVGWDGWHWGSYGYGQACGCRPISQIRLSGHVRSIVQVMIDGVVVDPSEYFVYKHRELVRKKQFGHWPRCQSLDVDDDADGAFTVTYLHGKPLPMSGVLAARALACEIVKSCQGDEQCALPNGVVRQTRQGITIERSFFIRQRVGVRPGDVVWATGIGEVDYFLNTVNPNGLKRNSTFWSPSHAARFAPTHPS